MPSLSPSVDITEINYTAIVPAVSTTPAAIAGRFNNGPLNVPVLITSETDLVSTFGTPDNTNYMEWFAAAQFLQYSSSLYVVRAEPSGVLNATWSASGFLIDNQNTFNNLTSIQKNAIGNFAAKVPGTIGNSLGVIIVDAAGWNAFTAWAATITNMPSNITFDKYFSGAPSTTQYVSSLAVNTSEAKYDEVHILVYDSTGNITGTKNKVLEIYQGLSKATDAIDSTGKSIFAPNNINQNSKYVWMVSFPSVSATSTSLDANTNVAASQIAAVGYNFAQFTFTSVGTTYSLEVLLSGGVAGTTAGDAQIQTAYSQFSNPDNISIGHVITAGFDATIIQYCVNTLAYGRGDAMAYMSVYNGTPGTPILDTDTTPEQEAVTCKNSWNLADMYAQYSMTDSGYKYIFDKYNNVYRWIPMNGDTAGIAARLGYIAQEFYSPGGFNRGGLINVIKLGFNPNKAQRDVIYPVGINPIVHFNNQGVVLFGDRTGTTKPSAFDRYNVRRLFIILEKAISIAARYQLFEFNDVFTQAAFKNMVEPFLRTIQGQRGIIDFTVICDSTVNTPAIVDSNQFVGQIWVNPARSINNITLTFVAENGNVSFNYQIA